MGREVPWGVCVSESLVCGECDFRSGSRKLYDEISTGQRGRKAGSPNYKLQIGLSHTSIGNTEMSQLLNTLDIPSPSNNAMQKASNKVCDQLVDHNERCMKNIISDLKQMDSVKNSPQPFVFNAEPATQVSLVTVENTTKDKKIVDLVLKNKLCRVARGLQKTTGLPVKCPNHRGKCTATLQKDEVIGNEGRWAEESLRKLAETGANVKHLTTDADSTLFSTAENLHAAGITATQPVQQLDTRHLGKSQRSKVKLSIFSDDTFPGRTADERKRAKARFADDLAARCHAEHSQAHRQAGRYPALIKRHMTYVVDAIVMCYQGNHALCKIHSFVCKGTRGDNWVKNSCYLGEKGMCKLQNWAGYSGKNKAPAQHTEGRSCKPWHKQICAEK